MQHTGRPAPPNPWPPYLREQSKPPIVPELLLPHTHTQIHMHSLPLPPTHVSPLSTPPPTLRGPAISWAEPFCTSLISTQDWREGQRLRGSTEGFDLQWETERIRAAPRSLFAAPRLFVSVFVCGAHICMRVSFLLCLRVAMIIACVLWLQTMGRLAATTTTCFIPSLHPASAPASPLRVSGCRNAILASPYLPTQALSPWWPMN